MLDTGLFPYGLYPEATTPPDLVTPAAEATVRLATASYHSDRADDPPSTAWPERILSLVDIGQDVIGTLGVGGVVALTAAAIDVHDGDGWAATMARYGTADGRDLDIRLAEVLDDRASDFGTPLRNTAVVWRGPVARVERLPGRRARISLGDATARLSALLQPLRYAGTGGLQGPSDLADRPQPVCLGRCFNVEPVALGNIDLGDGAKPTYQVHWRAIAGIDAVRVRGVAMASVGSAPGFAEYRPWLSLGLFQLGNTPDGSVRCDVRGEADGYPNTIAQILWRLLTVLGPNYVEGNRDSTSWAFAEADLPGEAHFYQPAEDVTALAAVQRLLAGCGAVLAGDRAGQLRLFDPFAAARDLQFDLTVSDLVAEPEPIALTGAIWPTPREIQVEWGRNAYPIPDIGTAADADLRQRLTDGTAPAAIYASALVTGRVRQQRALRLPGVYAALADAQARAELMGAYVEGGPEAVRVTTDRYLGQVNLGDIGRITYPGFGLEAGLIGVVLGWGEQLDRRRLQITIVGAGG